MPKWNELLIVGIIHCEMGSQVKNKGQHTKKMEATVDSSVCAQRLYLNKSQPYEGYEAGYLVFASVAGYHLNSAKFVKNTFFAENSPGMGPSCPKLS